MDAQGENKPIGIGTTALYSNNAGTKPHGVDDERVVFELEKKVQGYFRLFRHNQGIDRSSDIVSVKY